MADVADGLGYARDKRIFKENLDGYQGVLGDYLMIIRVALTNRRTTPDLYHIMQIMGEEQKWVPEGSTVAVGDSMTLFETGIIEMLRNGKYHFLNKYRDGITRAEKQEIYRRSFSADAFLCSTNALTEACRETSGLLSFGIYIYVVYQKIKKMG